MIKRFFLMLVFLPALLTAAGQNETASSESEELSIFTSHYPLYFAAESLLKGNESRAELLWLFPEGEDPAFWEPSREDLEAVQKADLLIFNGADYEKWRNYAFLDESHIVDSSSSFAERYIDTGEGVVHSHGGGTEHSHGGTAFSVWLDLQQYALQLLAVKGALSIRFPDADFSEGYEYLRTELDKLDAEFKEAGTPFKNGILMASHPVYQYFARAYLGEIRAMLWEPDVYPSEEEWTAFESMKEKSAAYFMIWEDEPLPETRTRLEEMGLELIIIQPGFAMPESGDFLDILKENLKELQRAGGLS